MWLGLFLGVALLTLPRRLLVSIQFQGPYLRRLGIRRRVYVMCTHSPLLNAHCRLCVLQVVCMAAGLLPFGSIFIETYFIFTSFWNYKFYYVYGFMLIVFVILTIVVSCVTVVATYFMLNSEGTIV
jgi:hypothetical protein